MLASSPRHGGVATQDDHHDHAVVVVAEEVTELAGWPTDTVRIDRCCPVTGRILAPHTVVLFVPGNPGCVGWYVELLRRLVARLGDGFAARGVSYAGHGVGERIVGPDEVPRHDDDDPEGRRRRRVAWTLDGQVEHKTAWWDRVRLDLDDDENVEYVFLGHSIGCHLIQRLCASDPGLLHRRVRHVVFLMPFIWFDPPRRQRVILHTAARTQRAALALLDASSRVLRYLVPTPMLDYVLEHGAHVECPRGRRLALDLVTSPAMARNFLTLGVEEVRDVPQTPDVSSLRLIGSHCPISMLYVGTESEPDQWAPHSHIDKWKELQRCGKLPLTTTANNSTYHHSRGTAAQPSLSFCHLEGEFLHDFVVHPNMLPPIIDFCVASIVTTSSSTTSRDSHGTSPPLKTTTTDKVLPPLLSRL